MRLCVVSVCETHKLPPASVCLCCYFVLCTATLSSSPYRIQRASLMSAPSMNYLFIAPPLPTNPSNSTPLPSPHKHPRGSLPFATCFSSFSVILPFCLQEQFFRLLRTLLHSSDVAPLSLRHKYSCSSSPPSPFFFFFLF